MARKITLVESIISVGFDGKAAQRGLSKLKKQLKDQDKTKQIGERRQEKADTRRLRNLEKAEKAIKREHRAAARERRASEVHDMRKEKHSNTMETSAKKERRAKNRERRLDRRDRRLDASHSAIMGARKKATVRADSRERRLQEAHNMRMESSSRRRSKIRGGVGMGSVGAVAGGAAVGTGAGAMAMQTTMTWENAMNALYTQEAAKDPTGAGARTQKLSDTIYRMASAQNVADPSQLLKTFTELRPLADNTEGVTDETILGMVSTMSQASKATGLSGPMFERFMLGFRQFASNLSAGTASGQEIGQMRDSSAALTNMFFEAMGIAGNITPDAAAKLIQSGNLNIGQMLGAMPKLQEQTKAGFDLYKTKSMQGAVDELAMIFAHTQRIFGEGTKGGLLKFLNSLGQTLTTHEGAFKTAGEWVGTLLQSMGEGVAAMNEAWKGMSAEEQKQFVDTMKQIGLAFAMFVGAGAILGFMKSLTKLSKALPSQGLIALIGSLIYLTGKKKAQLDEQQAANRESGLAKDGVGLTTAEVAAVMSGDQEYGFLDFLTDVGGMMNSASATIHNLNPYNTGTNPYETLSSNTTTPTGTGSTDNRTSSSMVINGLTVTGDAAVKARQGIMQAVAPQL